jgi:hypothetical protein
MNRVERILEKYSRDNISFDIITGGCIKVAIKLNNSCKRIISLNAEESDLFIQLI